MPELAVPQVMMGIRQTREREQKSSAVISRSAWAIRTEEFDRAPSFQRRSQPKLAQKVRLFDSSENNVKLGEKSAAGSLGKCVDTLRTLQCSETLTLILPLKTVL